LLYEFATVSNLVSAALHLDVENIEMPVEFRFRHARPEHADAYSLYLPAPVRFGCEHYATVFKKSTLERPLKTADPILHQVLLRQAEIELAALPRAGAFSQRVRDAIERDLAAGASLESVAQRLHLSASNLRRRLKQQGCTFSELLEATRREQAQLLLRDPELTSAQIADRLGFAHAPAFHRAFKRWFGRSIKDYRAWIADHHTTRFWSKRNHED
jgi:AraC-like DNA-binding protein